MAEGPAPEFPFVDLTKIEPRLYQVNLFKAALNGSTLCVLPTGMGKTIVALMLAGRVVADARALDAKRGATVVMMAPTKPLVEQHAAFFRTNLLGGRAPPGVGESVAPDAVIVADLTGEVPPGEREELWRTSEIVLATPQVIRNDLAAGRISLSAVRLMVLDEAHRATGDYAYVPLAQAYREAAGKSARILGLTASPGGNARDILAVCQALGIYQVDVRTEDDPDVAPYVHDIGVNWIEVELPSDFKVIASKLRRVIDHEARKLQEAGVMRRGQFVSAGDLIRAREQIQAALARLPPREKGRWWALASAQAKAMKVNHALEYIETQGADVFVGYMDRLADEARQKGGSAASRSLSKDPDFLEAYALAKATKSVHPKVEYVAKLVRRSLDADPEGRIILFAHYRETGEVLLRRLEAMDGVRPIRFTGQATRGNDVGLTQDEQVALIKQFEAGKFNVLIATSVAEEGLDIPQVDHVIFYEPVSSEIRTIQRRGRTGRRRAGSVEVLVAKKTRDEAYRRASDAREVTMREELKKLRVNLRLPIEVLDAPQEGEVKRRLEDFAGAATEAKTTQPQGRPGAPPAAEAGVRVLVDDREMRTPVPDRLRGLGLSVVPQRLEVGDFVVMPRLGIERKTLRDFAKSIEDGRLFAQAEELSRAFEHPVLVVEGDESGGFEGLSAEAFHGALAALMVDFEVAVLRTRDWDQTAAAIAALARRAGGGPKPPASPAPPRANKTGLSLAERQRFVLEGLPGVSDATARKLLAQFGSIRAIAHASLEEIAAVAGVGRKTAEQVFDVLRSAYPADGGG